MYDHNRSQCRWDKSREENGNGKNLLRNYVFVERYTTSSGEREDINILPFFRFGMKLDLGHQKHFRNRSNVNRLSRA